MLEAIDLITQDFPADGTVKVVAQSKTPTGITMKATLSRFFKKEKSGPREIVSALIEPKYEMKENNLEFSAKLSTANEFSGTISLKDTVGRGSKIDVTGTQSERNGVTVQLGSAYKTDIIASKVNVTYPVGPNKKDKNPIKVLGELVLQYPTRFLLGSLVSVDVDSENTAFRGEGIVAYTQGDAQFSLRGSHENDKKTDNTILGTTFYHQLSPNFKYTVDFDVDRAYVRGPVAAIAGEVKLDDATSLKGKGTVKLTPQSKQSEMRIALSAKQKMSTYFTATFGADLNLSSLLGQSVGDAHSFGVEFKIQD